MNRRFTGVLSFTVLLAATLCILSTPVLGQTPPEIQSLAVRTADRVSKTHQQHIFLAGLQECKMDEELCNLLELSLRSEIEKVVPGAALIQRESIINILEGRGFLALDAYFPDVLKAVATQAGADVLVTYTLKWKPDGYDFISEVYDSGRDKKLDQFRVKIARPQSDASEEPFIFTDPESKASFILVRGNQTQSLIAANPKCVRCPDPSYTPEARAQRIQGRVLVMATITEKGAADQIGVVEGLAAGLTGQAVEALRIWEFKPATGKDGKPIAVRVPIEVNFRLK
jgi:TonB family protein